MESIWQKTVTIPTRPFLPGSIEVDAVVIGAGMAGVLTAFFLQKEGLDTVVLEADRIGSGQTAGTTAKITSQHNLIYDRLIRQWGEEKAREYARRNQAAVAMFRRMVRENHIDCQFEDCPAWLYSEAEADALRQEEAAAIRLGIEAGFSDRTELPFPVAGALQFPNQARFNPLAFLKEMEKHLTIYENTLVKTVLPNRAETQRGNVTAKYIIFASHFPFVNVPGFYFMRMDQERSYVLSLAQAPHLKGMYLSVDKGLAGAPRHAGLSFRNAGDELLITGGGHRSGVRNHACGYAVLEQAAGRLWPDSRETGRWSAQDCITWDGVPYIGRFASSRPDWYVATGFGKWGMSHSMAAAMMIAELIGQRERTSRRAAPAAGQPQDAGGGHVRNVSPDAVVSDAGPEETGGRSIFSPSRFSFKASGAQLMADMKQSVLGEGRQCLAAMTDLLLRKLPKEEAEKLWKELPMETGCVVNYEGKKTGAYKEKDGTVYLVSLKCPHLKCRLTWNQDEKSWDCPCHGSRFDCRGKLLDDPAQTDIRLGQSCEKQGMEYQDD